MDRWGRRSTSFHSSFDRRGCRLHGSTPRPGGAFLLGARKTARHGALLGKLFLEGFAVAAGQRGRVMFGSHFCIRARRAASRNRPRCWEKDFPTLQPVGVRSLIPETISAK